MRLKTKAIFILVFFLLSVPASASDLSLSGHLKYQPTLSIYRDNSLLAENGPDEALFNELDLRVNSELEFGRWDLALHAEVLGINGNGLDARRSVFEQSPLAQRSSLLIEDDNRLVDLTTELIDESNTSAVLRIDRAVLRYSSEDFVFKIGRQALSWGNALIFSVLDIFNPFSPTEIDKDYKTGDDMLHLQWLLSTTADLQAVVVARRDGQDSLRATESSAALKYRQRIESLLLDLDFLASRHYDENLFGVGFSRTLLDGVLRSDASYVDLQSGSEVFSFSVNYDRSWVLFDKNVYTYAEYFRSGVGESDGSYQSLETELLERLSRGELFLLGRDYLAVGTQVELTPLLQWFTPVIFNLHDESGIIQQRFEYDFSQNIETSFGANIPFGAIGSEFGGVRLGASGLNASPGLSLYLRLSYYF